MSLTFSWKQSFQQMAPETADLPINLSHYVVQKISLSSNMLKSGGKGGRFKYNAESELEIVDKQFKILIKNLQFRLSL